MRFFLRVGSGSNYDMLLSLCYAAVARLHDLPFIGDIDTGSPELYPDQEGRKGVGVGGRSVHLNQHYFLLINIRSKGYLTASKHSEKSLCLKLITYIRTTVCPRSSDPFDIVSY